MSSFQGEQGPSPPRRVPLGRLLIARGLLTEEQLIEGLLEQDRTGDRLGQVLIRLGFVDEPSVAMALATQHGGPLKTEYGFATGFDPGGATEPAIEAPLNPDPGTSLPHLSDRRLTDKPDVTVNGSSETVTALVATDTADAIAPTPVETAPIHSQRDAVFGDPETFPAELDQAPSQVDAMIAQADPTQAQLDAAQTRIADLELELMDAREQLTEERSKTAALDVARTRIADLERELVDVREQLDERRSKTAELEEQVAGARLAAETAIAALRGVTEAPALVGAD